MEEVTSSLDPEVLAAIRARAGGVTAAAEPQVNPDVVAAIQARVTPKPPLDLSSFGATPGGEYASLEDPQTRENIRRYGPMALGVGAGFVLPGSGPVTAGITSMGVGEGVRALEHKLAGSDWLNALYQGATDTSRIPGTSIRVPSVAADAVAPAAIMGGLKGGAAIFNRLIGKADPMMSRVADTGYESPPEMPKYGEAPGTQYRDVELKPLMGPPREPMGPPRPPEPGVPWTPPAQPDIPPWTPPPVTPKFPLEEVTPWTPPAVPDVPPWTPPGPGRGDWPGQVPYTPPPGFPGAPGPPPEPGVPWTPRRIDEITPAPVSPAGRFGTRLEDILQPQLVQREAQLRAQAEAAQLAAAQARQATYQGVPGGQTPTILDEIADVARRSRVTEADPVSAIIPEPGVIEPDLRPREIPRSLVSDRSLRSDVIEPPPETRTVIEEVPPEETSTRYLGRTREPGGRDYTVAPEGGIGQFTPEEVGANKIALRSGAGYLPYSPDPRLREIGQRLTAYNSTYPRLTDTGLSSAQEILGGMPGEQQADVIRYFKGELPDAPEHIVSAANAIEQQIYEPIAKRSIASGRTTLRDSGEVVPWEPVTAKRYVTEYSATEPTVSSRQATRGTGRLGLLFGRSKSPGTNARTDLLDVLREYIPRENKQIALSETFGPLTERNPDAPYGVWAQNLLKDANEAGVDPLGVQIASRALREAYEPQVLDPTQRWIRQIPARAYLGWNWLTQPRQLSIGATHFGMANQLEGLGRLADPGYRAMVKGSGGVSPSRGRFLEKAFDVLPETWAGKLTEATDSLNRLVTGAAIPPHLEDLETAARSGHWNSWNETHAAEAGLTLEQLQRGLTQGEVQSAIAHLTQRKQLNPIGAGERVDVLQSPGQRLGSGYLDYKLGQNRQFYNDYLKPAVSITKPARMAGGLGRIGRAAAYSLPVEIAALAAHDIGTGRMMNPNAKPRTGQDVLLRALDTHAPLASDALKAVLPGPRQDFMSSPIASSVSDITSGKPESLVDILLALDTYAGQPAGPFSQALTLGSEPIKNFIRAQRTGR